MELSFRKNLVFPGGGDFPLPMLLGVEEPRAWDGLVGLAEAPPTREAIRVVGSVRGDASAAATPAQSPIKAAGGPRGAEAETAESGSGEGGGPGS